MKKLKFISENYHKLLRVFDAIGLEKPSQSGLVLSDAPVIFSGWLLKKDINQRVVIEVFECEKLIHSFELTIKRPDVIEHFNLNPDIHSSHLGFNFQLSADEFDSIKIVCGESSVEAWEVDEVQKYLPEFHENIMKNLFFSNAVKDNDARLLSNKINEDINSFISSIQFIEEIEQLDPATLLNLPCDLLVKEVSNSTWTLNAAIRAENDEPLFAFDTSNEFKAVGSFVWQDVNFLFVKSFERGLVFIVVQYCSNIALYFPHSNTYLPLVKISVWHDRLLKGLVESVQYAITLYISRKGFTHCKFNGLVLAEERPYHFFYDGLFYLENFDEKSESRLPLKLFCINKYCFFDVTNIYPKFDCAFLEPSQINAETAYGQGYNMLASYEFSKSPDIPSLNSLDSKLKLHSVGKGVAKLPQFEVLCNESEFVLWVGISAEKRAWVSQEREVIKLVNELSNRFKRILIVFDGRTFPMAISDSDEYQRKQDLILVEKMEKQLNDSCSVVCTSGMTSQEKIDIASRVDFFITSIGTDSIYVSRMNSKTGIAYFPSTMPEGPKSMHIHPNAKLLSVEPVSTDRAKDWHLSSVDIDYQKLVKAFDDINGKS